MARQTKVPRRDDDRVAAFVEHLGATLEGSGMPRIASRVLVLLMASDEGALTAAEIGEALQVSPAAVSSAVGYLNHVGLTARLRAPGGRREMHRLVADDWYTSFLARGNVLGVTTRLMMEGAEAAGGVGTAAGRRLWLDAQLFEFLEGRLVTALEEWRRRREELERELGPPPAS